MLADKIGSVLCCRGRSADFGYVFGVGGVAPNLENASSVCHEGSFGVASAAHGIVVLSSEAVGAYVQLGIDR